MQYLNFLGICKKKKRRVKKNTSSLRNEGNKKAGGFNCLA